MRKYEFVTVDVFTDRRFGGNPLAVFPDARGLSDEEMQKLAAEMNLSETTFVLPPGSDRNTARVRIFNRTAEMPFAGHPNVGTGFVLAQRDPRLGSVLRFEEIAGLVEVRPIREADGSLTGAEIDAPQPLQILSPMPAEGVAGCIGLPSAAIVASAHPPLRATMGVDFVIAEVEARALSRATPVLAALQALADAQGLSGERLSILLYARDGGALRSRMFAPLSGTWEDPATGSANAILGALLLSLGECSDASYDITQGTEMGRESRLRVSARRTADGIRASVAGGCVQVLRGEASV
ncbi:MAG TPA: PhzF family phenazine biosynthesis protein [Allosphingosinicella sp.]